MWSIAIKSATPAADGNMIIFWDANEYEERMCPEETQHLYFGDIIIYFFVSQTQFATNVKALTHRVITQSYENTTTTHRHTHTPFCNS